MQAFIAVAEVSLILTQRDPTSPLAKLVASIFVLPGGDPRRLRLTMLHVIAGTMMSIGGLVRVIAFKSLGKYFTFQVGIQSDQNLITSGLYSIVRHPSYAAMLFTQPGVVLWSLTPGSWVRECGILNSRWGAVLCTIVALRILVVVYVIPFGRMPEEDKMLKKKFGKEWEEWAARVRYRLIPGVY
ncbi:hypothetical protein CVT24_010123 [Panaeolus cyanescens]|uniref:Protein-S-isoprenylcysteine O-methyltransferase n=1 Tax=Panaeolus cyanescens TaxID=181874 RepID=A0A409WMJ8_9AGAR|nr:hypothetical protein CVT24_010123 [Panaeolus cyanescens]